MSPLVTLLLLAALIFLSAVFSGSETGLYSLSPVRLELEAREGRRSALLVRRLVRRDTTLLVTILIGNNLMLELATHSADGLLVSAKVPAYAHELLLTICLTPLIFLFGELLPKELFRRRPHTLLGFTAPILALARVVFAPLGLVLTGISQLLALILGLEADSLRRLFDREGLSQLFREGELSGAIVPHAGELAQNVLRLRGIQVAGEMVPWKEVLSLRSDRSDAELFREVRESPYSRLPVVDARGRVEGYVLQLDVLAAGAAQPVLESVRPLEHIPAETPVERALVRMRRAGLRAIVVGPPEAPAGLLTLKDLVEKISGDLADW